MENNFSVCKGCGENIRWIKTRAGQNMPCEIAGVQGITFDGDYTIIYIPHWGRCIKAKDFKKNVKK